MRQTAPSAAPKRLPLPKGRVVSRRELPFRAHEGELPLARCLIGGYIAVTHVQSYRGQRRNAPPIKLGRDYRGKNEWPRGLLGGYSCGLVHRHGNITNGAERQGYA